MFILLARSLSLEAFTTQLVLSYIAILSKNIVKYGKPLVSIFPVHYDQIKLSKHCHIMALCHNILTIMS